MPARALVNRSPKQKTVSVSTSGAGPERLCAISGVKCSERTAIPLGALRPQLQERILKDHPILPPDAVIARQEVDRYQELYFEEIIAKELGELSRLEHEVAESLARHETISENVEQAFDEKRTLGERWSDYLAAFGGSWKFLIIFGALMCVWISANAAIGTERAFDPYPFILLNLVLSCIAAIQAPVIMMSQRRQEAKDRARSNSDYQVNLKAELEIRHLHEKLDHLIHNQWQKLTELQRMQLELLHDKIEIQTAAR